MLYQATERFDDASLLLQLDEHEVPPARASRSPSCERHADVPHWKASTVRRRPPVSLSAVACDLLAAASSPQVLSRPCPTSVSQMTPPTTMYSYITLYHELHGSCPWGRLRRSAVHHPRLPNWLRDAKAPKADCPSWNYPLQTECRHEHSWILVASRAHQVPYAVVR